MPIRASGSRGLSWATILLLGCAGRATTSMSGPTLSSEVALGLQSRSAPRSGVLRLKGGKAGGIKARDLWDKDFEELDQLEEELRTELMSLRVAQQVGGQPGRVNRICMVRKSIARVLTVVTSKRRAEEYAKVEKAKYKPLDARPNRHWTKAMRLRLNKFERTRKSRKALKCLRARVWGAGERPMKRFLGLKEELEAVFVGRDWTNRGDRNFEKNPPHKRGAVGKQTSTGHIPKHAEEAMRKRKDRWQREAKRIKALKEARGG